MRQQLFLYKNSRIHYYRFGSGPAAVICFHGYAENGRAFESLGQHLGNQYSFYAIDLPFHGATEWNEGLVFTPADLQEITLEMLDLEAHPADVPCTLLGFSLGGRMALSLYQHQPAQYQRMVLLAPDGLKINPWYRLATQTWLGNRFFAFTMRYPKWFFIILQLVNKLGMVNSSVFKFVSHYIGNKEARDLLYTRWTGFRKIKPNLKKIKAFLREAGIPVRLIYGRHDRIILPARAQRFKNDLGEQCTLAIIESGHQVLHEKHLGAIVSALVH